MAKNKTNPKRDGKKWTINEELSLQREHQLLEMSIEEIANKHQRTPESILKKLSKENFFILT
jgi:hypothetical protein